MDMMDIKNVKTIGGILLLLAATLSARLEGLVSDQVLVWIALVAGMIAASYSVAIGGTEWFKRRKFSQKQIDCINDMHSMECDEEKRQTYDFAVICGFSAMLVCGVIFILLQVPDWRYKVVIAVLWLFACFFVGLTAPLVWRLLRKRFIKVADEDEHEAEALQRPGEKLE
jgi:hypothetical protein